MTLSPGTILSPRQREQLAADPAVGGGNVLPSAIAASPHPELPFLRSARPLVDASGQRRHEFSLLDLDQLVQGWSVWYLEQGARPRDRVAVWIEDSFAYSVHFYALAQIGAIAVLVNSNASRAIARSLVEQTQPVGLFTSQARRELIGTGGSELASLRWVVTAEDVPAPGATALPKASRFRHSPADPVCLLHSSGTTGRPKPTIHTHRSIVSGPKFRLVDHKESVGALTMTSLPQSHLGCISYTTYAVLAGAHTVAANDNTGAALAGLVREHQPTAVMSFAHAYAELAGLDDLPPGTVDSVNVWVSMGDAAHVAHIKSVLGRRSPDREPARFLDRLGTTELGWGVLLKTWTLDSDRSDRCAGKPVGVAEVAVLRADGTEAGPREIGLLGARGPAVTPGYWNNCDTTYRSMLAGYWLTGDNAYRDANGDHFLVDRAVDVIETASGTGFSVFMEEAVLAELREVVDCAVVAGRDSGKTVPVAVVTTADSGAEPQHLLKLANDALRRADHPPLGVLEIAQSEADFPVGVTGKVLKRTLRDKYGALGSYLADQAGKKLAVDVTF
jgi:acyl-coenzyme A synthetase/AMP-(fatty) acid ligase